ncbi:MAG: glycosyltransferase family 4 protein [Alphaproteobacteria bacterium]|nr:glycosyltransferase family 4 protein [Alphaproteobacteria bacterium]
MNILTTTTLFPNSVQTAHGIFVETRLRRLLADGRVRARVLAPVGWVPPGVPKEEWARLRQIPAQEQRNGITADHPRYLVVPKIGMNLTPYTLYAAMKKRLAQLIAAGEKYDVIDAHYFYPDGVAAVWLGKEFNIPVTITARGTDINLIPEYARPRRLILEAARDAGALITVCQALKDRLVELGAPSSKITTLRNGVDLEIFQMLDRASLRKKWDLNGFVLASVGLLIERKGHDLAIAALPQIPDATLLIVGAGPERAALEKLAERLGVKDRVRFLGMLDQKTLREIYNCADALILASSREGWANVLLEAMACGTPVLASAVWGTPEVVATPEAGLLLKNRDAASIVAATAQLRSAFPDRAETRRYAEQFDWQSTTNGQVRIFEALKSRTVNL